MVYSILLFTTGKVSISTRRMRNAISSLTANADGEGERNAQVM